MEIFDLMSKLHKSTNSALIDNQLGYIPVVYELEQEKYPDVIEIKHQLRRTNSYRILQRNDIVKFNQLKETTYLTDDELFKNGVCRKILCIDEYGKHVKQDTISIICDERTVYINSSDDYAKLKYCIVFMTDPKEDSIPLFYMNKLGDFNSQSLEGEITINCPYLITETVFPDENGYIECKEISNKYKIFSENIFVFKNRSFQYNCISRYHGNVFKINNYTPEDKWFARIIYYPDDDCIDNINKLESKINLLELMIEEVPDYIEKIQSDFDFRPDYTKSYKENLTDILEYIANYNPEGMLEYFLANNNSIIEEYKGRYFINKSNDNMCYIPRRRKGKTYNYVIIYKNGLLFEDIDLVKYNVMSIGIPTTHIEPEDEIVLQFFLDCNNNTFEVTFKENEINNVNYKLLTDNPKNIQFHSPEFEGRHLYDLTIDERRQYNVDYTYEKKNNGTMNVELDNPFLYNKPLKMGSKRKFVHDKIKLDPKYSGLLKSTIYNIENLSTTFKNERANTIEEFDSLFRLENGVTFVSSSDVSIDKISFTNQDKNDTYMNDFPSEVPSKYFAWILEGYFFVDEEDDYTISLLSNNGSMIFIDDKMLIYDVFGQGILEDFSLSNNQENIHLNKGYHKIKIHMANHSDILTFALGWKLEKEGPEGYKHMEKFYKEKHEILIKKLYDTDFRYCLLHGHYILFYQNRRLYSNEAYIKVPGLDQVYDEVYLFISKPIPEDAIIDIFYVPDLVQEVYRNNKLSKDGYITIDKDELLNTFHPDLCGVFVNGKFIAPSKMKYLANDCLKITSNIHTLGAVSVLKYNMYDRYANTLFEYAEDIWTNATKLMPTKIKDIIIGESEEITDDEPDFFKPECIDLIWAIIKKFWIDRFGLIDAEVLFQYNDDPKVLKRSKVRQVTIESDEYQIDDNIEYSLYEQDYYKYHKFKCINPSTLYFGKFENLDINKKYSLSMSVSMYLNIYGNQERFYCEIYDNNGNREMIPLYYNSEPTLKIKDVPKCYCLRLYLDNIPITETKNNIRIVCKLETPGEYIKFKDGVFLEEGVVAIRNIQVIPIDAEIETGVELPYGEMFKPE